MIRGPTGTAFWAANSDAIRPRSSLTGRAGGTTIVVAPEWATIAAPAPRVPRWPGLPGLGEKLDAAGVRHLGELLRHSGRDLGGKGLGPDDVEALRRKLALH